MHLNRFFESPARILLAAVLIVIASLSCKKAPASAGRTSSPGNSGKDRAASDVDESSQTPAQRPEQAHPPRPAHKHTAFTERRAERAKMVDRQMRKRGIAEPNVLSALETVPRHAFVRHGDLRQAYNDYPLPIGSGQTISQPYIVAYMTEALNLRPHFKVLEVGTGSGYQAAVCAEIAGSVYTIEIIRALADSAEKRLKELGYANVFVKNADGYYGWPDKAPFDAIIITCATGFVPPPLIEQLKPHGIMILPLGTSFGYQVLVVITKDAEGKVSSKELLPVRFVPMLGRAERGR
jgi:protein-L-isoaspartate(D-aspartate) O-methyltransferase